MFGPSLDLLRQFDSNLRQHFRALQDQRPDRPVFLLEHGLDAGRLSEMTQCVAIHARMEGLNPARWPNATLPLAITITETGYGYRGTGTEFWPRLGRDLGIPVTGGDRLSVRALFEGLSQRFGIPHPHDSDWARAFNIIAWPIRNALAPLEIHRPLAVALGKLAASGGQGLSDEDFHRRLTAIAEGLWSRRLSDWLGDKVLAVSLGRNLLSGENSHSWIEPLALARIGRDIRMDAECRQVLRTARRSIRSQPKDAGIAVPAASWLASVSVTGQSHRLEGLMLRGPILPQRAREVILGRKGRSRVLTIGSRARAAVFLDEFLQGEVASVANTEDLFSRDLLRLEDAPEGNDLADALFPGPPSLFRWAASGGMLVALGDGDIVHGHEQLLQVSAAGTGSTGRPTGALDIESPAGIVAWVAEATLCRIALSDAGARIAETHLAEISGTARLQREGNRIIIAPDTPLFLRALKPEVEVSLGKPVAQTITMAQGDVAVIPAPSAAMSLLLRSGQSSETWIIGPGADETGHLREFTCRSRPAVPGLSDLQSGELVLAFSAPVALGPTQVRVALSRNGEALAATDVTLPGLPARLSFSASELSALREASFEALAFEEARWRLTATVDGLGVFDFALPARQGRVEPVPGRVEWRREDGVLVGPGQSAGALSMLLEADLGSEHEGGDIRLYLPDGLGTLALREGILTGKVALFGRADTLPTLPVARALHKTRWGYGLVSLCEALIAWRSATAGTFLADARRWQIVEHLEQSILHSLCGEEWVSAEAETRRMSGGLPEQLATAALACDMAGGQHFPRLAAEDMPLLRQMLANRFAAILRDVDPEAWLLTEDDAGLLDEAVDQSYAEISADFEARGLPGLEETWAGNEAARWKSLIAGVVERRAQSPFRHLILPETRWEALRATSYDRQSDDDLVDLLARCHLDISRTSGIEWVGPGAMRSGLMLWLSPASLTDAEAWRDHMARLLSDRHTARAIRYVALRLREAERAAFDRQGRVDHG